MGKAEKKTGTAKGGELVALRAAVHAVEEAVVREVVKDACDRVHELVVASLSEVAAQTAGARNAEDPLPNGAASTSKLAEWKRIGSLSEIRRLVGGRFQNLKNRWVNAGFPLREHRGDRNAEFKLVESGWEEFHAWLLQQGFESRLSSEKDGTLFEIRIVK